MSGRNRDAEEAERIGRKARRLLNDAGWDSSRATLELELDSSESIVFDAEDRGLILARAEGLQREQRIQNMVGSNSRGDLASGVSSAAVAPAAKDPVETRNSRARERQLPKRGPTANELNARQTAAPAPEAEEETMSSVETEPTIDRDAVREFLREERTKNKDLEVPAALELAREKFGLVCTYASFYSTYWKKSEPVRRRAKAVARNGRRPASKAVVRAIGGPPPAHSNGTPAIVGEPVLQIFKLSDGNVRIQFDMAPELGTVLQTVGAALNARKA